MRVNDLQKFLCAVIKIKWKELIENVHDGRMSPLDCRGKRSAMPVSQLIIPRSMSEFLQGWELV